MTLRRWLLMVLVGVLLLPALSLSAQDDKLVWIAYESEGVSLRVPPTWISLSDTAVLEQTLKDMKATNPDILPMVQQAETMLASKQISLFLIDFLTQYNLNVAILPGAGRGYTLEALEAALPAEFVRVGIDLLDSEIVELPTGGALQLRSHLTINAPTGMRATVGQYQYFVIMGDDAYVLTLTAPGSVFESAEPLFRRIANTLSIEAGDDAWQRHIDLSGAISMQAPSDWVPVEVAAASDFVLTLTRNGAAGATISLTESELTLADLETDLITSLDAAGIKIRSVEHIFLPAGEFIRLRIVNAGLPGAVEQYQYVTINKGQQISVLFTADQDDFADMLLIFEQLIDTLLVNAEDQDS